MAPSEDTHRFPIENWICSIAMSILPGSVPWYLKLLFSQNVGILVDVFFFFQFDKSKDGYFIYTWNPKQPFINGCLVISNHFLYKDLESSN